MIEKALKTQYFYFSYTYDLTHSLQQLQNTNPDFLLSSIYERVKINLFNRLDSDNLFILIY